MIEIRELWIDGFGCLRSPDAPFRFERDRITVFVDDNEAGKTTLQMAVLASLYGIETDKRLLRTSLRPHGTHWYPLGGPPFGTRIRAHDGKRLLEVRWNFADGGELHVVDLDGNRDVTAELCPDGNGLELGRRLLDLTIGEFSKTCMVGQDDLGSVRRVGGLDSLVQRAADSQAGDATVARALDRLREALRDYPEVVMLKGGHLDNEIRRLEADAADLRGRLAALEAEREGIATDDAEFQRLAAERHELRAAVARLEYLTQVAEHDELVIRVQKAQEAQAALEKLEAEYREVASLETFPAGQADQLTRWQAARVEALRQAEQAEKSGAELQTNALDPGRRDLGDQGRLATVGQDDLDGVSQLLGKTSDFESREQALLDAIRSEEERLAGEGASIEELDRLDERFKDLNAEDRGFILHTERATAQTASEVEEVKRRSLEASVRADRVLEARQRQREAARQWVTRGLVVGAVGLVAGGLLMIWSVAAGAAVLLAVGGCGAALVVKGHRASAAAEALQADELAQARLELSQLEERGEELAAERRDREARLKALATSTGYEQPEVLVDDYSTLDDLRRLCGTLIHLREQIGDMTRQRRAVEAEVDGTFAAYGEERRPDLSLCGALEDLQARMGRALRLQEQIRDWEKQVASEEARHQEFRQRSAKLTAQIRAVLVEAGVASDLSVEEGIAEFAELLKKHARMRQLRGTQLPQARAHTVDESVIQSWEADMERLHRAIATQREERPGLVAVQATERAADYRRERDEARRQLEELHERANEAGSRVVGILNRYHRERPGLEQSIAEREAQLARATMHKSALELAIKALEEIALEVHGRWAEELNRSTSELLERITPTLRDLKFDSRLHFGVWHAGGATPVRSTETSPILSSGTWDQLYLAVRLGLADFVGQRGTGGFLLLDDPFAHFDDERFERAMRVLADMAKGRQQVVVLSCQRQRFRWLEGRDAAWFRDNIVARRIGSAAPPQA